MAHRSKTESVVRLKLVERPVPSDETLVQAIALGDFSAFSEWFGRHQKMVFHLSRRFCVREEDARDLTQKVFLQALEAIRKKAPAGAGDNLKAWLATLAVNAGKNEQRRAHRWKWEDEEKIVSLVPSAEHAFEIAEQKSALRHAVHQLPERQRDVFFLRIDAELSFAEIGEALDMSETNAKAQFHLAVKYLRTTLNQPETAP